jgi:hypothetical protein
MNDGAKEQTRPLHVMWWQPVRVRWWTDEEAVAAVSQAPIEEVVRISKSYLRFCRVRQQYGGRIRRDSAGNVEVQVQVPFGRGPGPVVLCSIETATSPAQCRITA